MRRILSRALDVSLMVLVFLAAGASAQSGPAVPTLAQSSLLSIPAAQPDTQRVTGSLTRLQIPFVENDSRMDPRVSYYASTFAGTVFVTRDGKIVYSLPSYDKNSPRGARNKALSFWTLTETLVGGKPQPRGEELTNSGQLFHRQ
jgi:hypothetical protein